MNFSLQFKFKNHKSKF